MCFSFKLLLWLNLCNLFYLIIIRDIDIGGHYLKHSMGAIVGDHVTHMLYKRKAHKLSTSTLFVQLLKRKCWLLFFVCNSFSRIYTYESCLETCAYNLMYSLIAFALYLYIFVQIYCTTEQQSTYCLKNGRDLMILNTPTV